jgi:hypothetical protein
MKMAVFWVVASCSLVEVYKRFCGACCLHHRGTSETAVNVYHSTRQNNPEDSHLLAEGMMMMSKNSVMRLFNIVPAK